MVARAQSSDFNIFIRKIGYSVGLEQTLSRLKDFSNLYAGKDSISIGDIKRLLHAPKPAGWGLEENNEHILDFLRAINVITIRGNDVGVLEFGEALGILGRLLQGERFEAALNFLFAHALLIADGDIFLNALASEFEEQDFSARITRMLEYKWGLLESIFKTPQQRSAIYRSVTVEIQESNTGSRGKPSSRLGPLADVRGNKAGPLGIGIGRPDVRISKNYLVKTLGRRKAWASSLGLCNDQGKLTSIGQALLTAMIKVGYSGPSCLAMWPLEYELKTPLLSSFSFPEQMPVLSSWDFLILVGRSLGFLADNFRDGNEKDLDTLGEVLKCFYSLNKTRSIVRNEIPVRVAYRSLLAISIGADYIPDYPDLIKAEQKKELPRFIARESRLAEIALSTVR